MEQHLKYISIDLDSLERKIKIWIKEGLEARPDSFSEYDDIISIEEAMKITHLARQTIYGLVFERKIPFFKRPNSKKLFFSRTALLRWMQPDSAEESNSKI